MDKSINSQKCFISQVCVCIGLMAATYWYTGASNPLARLTQMYAKIPNITWQKIIPSRSDKSIDILNIPNSIVNGSLCKNLFSGKVKGDGYEMYDSPEWHRPDEFYINGTKDCSTYIKSRQYIMKPISQEEAEFPLAFSLVVYKDVHQVEQLLRLIYRPQNYYCIHVDWKAKYVVYKGLANIARCFKNVFIASRRFDIRWGEFTVLEPEFVCMSDLWNRTDWKYFINLTGQEFPLKTILDIVQILKAYNGSNAIHFDHKNTERFSSRIRWHYRRMGLPQMGRPKEPPPHNIRIIFGAVHVALTRGFVDYVLHNKIAADFREWLKDTNIPDETFFASLHTNPKLGVPGAYTGNTQLPWRKNDPYTRYKRWDSCRRWNALKTRNICILGVHDLPDLYRSPYMFANKFFHYHQPLGRMCLEELIFNQTRDQSIGRSRLNLVTYQEQHFVNLHKPS